MKKSGIKQSRVIEEYKIAKKEGRQPNCPYCHEPLEIEERQFTNISWTWDKKEKRFVKSEYEGDSGGPYCLNCSTSDYDFIDFDLVNF